MKLMLWLHREEADAWLVSRAGVGAGVYLPKSQIVLPPPGHPVPLAGPVGPVAIEVADWLAARERLVREDDPAQWELGL